MQGEGDATEAMTEGKYDEMLIEQGYDSLYVLDFDMDDLAGMKDANQEDIPKPRARALIRAATAVMKSLGVVATPAKAAQQLALGNAGGDSGTTGNRLKDRGEPAPIPRAESNMQVVAGLGTRARVVSTMSHGSMSKVQVVRW